MVKVLLVPSTYIHRMLLSYNQPSYSYIFIFYFIWANPTATSFVLWGHHVLVHVDPLPGSIWHGVGVLVRLADFHTTYDTFLLLDSASHKIENQPANPTATSFVLWGYHVLVHVDPLPGSIWHGVGVLVRLADFHTWCYKTLPWRKASCLFPPAQLPKH